MEEYAEHIDILAKKLVPETEERCPECDGALTEQGYCSKCRGAGQ